MIRNSFLKAGALLTAFVMIFALGFTGIPAYASEVAEDDNKETAVEEDNESDEFSEDTDEEISEAQTETETDIEDIAEEEKETPAVTVTDDDEIIFAGEVFNIRISEDAKELTYSKNLELIDVSDDECSFLAEEAGDYKIFVTYASGIENAEDDMDSQETVEEYQISVLSDTDIASSLAEAEETKDDVDESAIQWLDENDDTENEEESTVRTMASTSEEEIEEGTANVGGTLTIIANEKYEIKCSKDSGYTIEMTEQSGSIQTHVVTFSKEGYYEFTLVDSETGEIRKTYKITVDDDADEYGMTTTEETTSSSDGTTTTTTETTTTDKAKDGTEETVTVETTTTTSADGETTEDVEVTVEDEEDGETVTVDLTSEEEDEDTAEEVAEVEEAVAEAEAEEEEEIGKEDTTEEVGKEDTTSDVSSTGETKTGDTMNVVPWIVLGAIAIVGCPVGIYGYRRFRK